MRKVSLVLIFWVLTIAAIAQTGGVKGNVFTSNGKPAGFVNVFIKESGRGTSTTEEGTFFINGLKEGRYTVIVSFTGLETISQLVEVKAGQASHYDFTLNENSKQLAEVIIRAKRGVNDVPVMTGKVAIAPRDLPQSVQVIDKKTLERQQVLRLSDALQNVTGIYIMGTTGGYQEEIAARGYSFTSANTFKNGARYNNGTMPEMSGVERVEFLKGGSAILFGNVAAGGVMNIITKKPKFENGGEISFRAGSFDFYKPSIDVYGAFNSNGKAAYRLNSTYERGNSFRDNVKSERFYVNPSFLFNLGTKTELLIEGDYLKDDRTVDFGSGAINYKIADVPRGRFLGVDWGYNKSEQKTATATLTHKLNSGWQLRGMLSYQNYDAELFGAMRPTTVQENGNWVRGLQKIGSSERYVVGQLDLTGKFNTGKIEHTLLAGADADDYKIVSTRYSNTLFNNGSANASIRNKNIYDTINIFDPSTFHKRNDIPYLATERITTSPIQRFGIYVQDLVAITSKIKLLAGVRYSYQYNAKSKVDSTLISKIGFEESYVSDAFSPRIGLVYQPVKSISVYASYTSNFIVNTGVDSFNKPLKPGLVNQYEVGVKNDFFNGMLSANITVYKIVNSNFAQTIVPEPANAPGAKELAGEVTSKGVEVDIATKPWYGFSVTGGYSYNDTRYTKSNIYKTNDRLRYNPAHTGSLHAYYAFNAKSKLKGLNVGVGAYYVGDRLAGRNTSLIRPQYKLIELPNYMLFDLSAGYTMDNFSIRIKMSNVLNQLSYNVHDDNSVNPIAPRQWSATFAYKF